MGTCQRPCCVPVNVLKPYSILQSEHRLFDVNEMLNTLNGDEMLNTLNGDEELYAHFHEGGRGGKHAHLLSTPGVNLTYNLA